MSKIMSLEGPHLSPFARMRAGVQGVVNYTKYANAASAQYMPNPNAVSSPTGGVRIFVGILGAIAGGWLAGTPSGQALVRRIRGK